MIAGIVYEHSSKAQITQCTKYWCFSVNLLVISLINSKCNHSPCKQILFVMTCLRLQFYCFHHFAVSATGMQADLVSMAKKYLVIILSDSDGAVLVPNCLYPIHKTVGDAIWFDIYISTQMGWQLCSLIEIFQSCGKLWNVVIYSTYLHCNNHELHLTHCIWICCHYYKNERIASDSQAHYFNGKKSEVLMPKWCGPQTAI